MKLEYPRAAGLDIPPLFAVRGIAPPLLLLLPPANVPPALVPGRDNVVFVGLRVLPPAPE